MTDGKGRFAGNRAPLLAAAALLLLGTVLFARWFVRPEVPFLTPLGRGEWVGPPTSAALRLNRTDPVRALYRARFRVEEARSLPKGTLRAFRDCIVRVDGVEAAPLAGMGGWREEREVLLARSLSPGMHELAVEVVNDDGPPLLKFASPDLGLASGSGWEILIEDRDWLPVALASEGTPLPAYPLERGAVDALLKRLPFLLPAFLLGGALSLAAGREGGGVRGAVAFLGGGGRFRWFLYAFWALMAANNLSNSSRFIGFDVEGHLRCVAFLLGNGRLPLPSELLMAWHPPLFPAIMASFSILLDALGLARGFLLLVPLACGALQIELSWRLSRLAFPLRDDLQALATLFLALSPVNVYMSNSINNEPLAAILSASAVLVAAKTASGDAEGPSPRRIVFLGLLLGASMLTKVSALLLIPPLGLAVALGLRRGGEGARGAAVGVAGFLGVAAAVSGWWYALNLVRFGRLFVPNWEKAAGYGWWQEPGYWMLEHLYGFGRSLSRPVLSGMGRVPDSLYSTAWCDGWLSGLDPIPRWDYDFASSGAILGILPTAAILLGAIVALDALRRLPRAIAEPLPLSLMVVSLYLGALLFAYLSTPFYSGMKASHALGALPCFAVLAAAGFERICRPRLLRAAVWGVALAWFVMVAGGYLVR